MLVISRKADDRIKIGDDIWLTVLSVQGKSVKLGIDAPREIVISRGELVEESNGQVN